MADTPLQVGMRNMLTGSDARIAPGLAPGSLLGTTIRMVTSPVHVPVRRLLGAFSEPLEQDTCLAAIEEHREGARGDGKP